MSLPLRMLVAALAVGTCQAGDIIALPNNTVMRSDRSLVSLKAGTAVEVLERGDKTISIRYNGQTGTIPAGSLTAARPALGRIRPAGAETGSDRGKAGRSPRPTRSWRTSPRASTATSLRRRRRPSQSTTKTSSSRRMPPRTERPRIDGAHCPARSSHGIGEPVLCDLRILSRAARLLGRQDCPWVRE